MATRIGAWLGIFLVAGLVEVLLLPPGERPAVVSFDAGVAMAALLALRAAGARLTTAAGVVLVGAAASSALQELLSGGSGPWWRWGLVEPAATTVAVATTARLLQGSRLSMDRLSGVIRGLALGCLVPASLAASAGALAQLASAPGGPEAGLIWRRFWLAQLAGAFLALPLLVAWQRPQGTGGVGSVRLRGRRTEGALLAVLLVAVSAFIFADWLSSWVTAARLPYLVYPLLIWAALRFGPGGITAALLVAAWAAAWGTGHGLGPFPRPAFEQGVLFCQVFVIISVVTLLTLGAVFQERLFAEAQLGTAKDELESRVALRTAELTRANEELLREVAERQRYEEGLQTTERRLRTSLEEKEVLLKEIHHRVKNNLQIVSSLLYLQGRKMPAPEVQTVLQESQSRVRSMALVHERLYQSGDLASVDFAQYLEALVAHLVRTFARAGTEVGVRIEADGIRLPVDAAIPCGLIVNELCTNALKHAFVGRPGGTLRVALGRQGEGAESLLLEVCDDGVGLPPEATAGSPAGLPASTRGSLGLQLVSSLSQQLHGTLEVGSGPWGTRFGMRFPAAAR
jgi:two-component sensor histidine kinase/integral membrane sensor domain MASE1